MKKFTLFLSLILILFCNLPAFAKFTEEEVITKDKVNIKFDIYNTNHKEVIVLAHGWLMTKNSKAFTKMAKEFSKDYDVIVLDFRGHGKSSGKYSFGSKEINDLKPVVDFAHQKYEKVYLIGFSLGSLISVDYCSKYNNVDKLILVSAPTDFDKIENNVLSPNALIPTLKKFEWDRWTSIRLGKISDKKIKPVEEISKIQIPILLIAGEKDPIIHSWHNKELYKNTKSKNKKSFVIKNGKHAEDLYLETPETFMNMCIEFLNN